MTPVARMGKRNTQLQGRINEVTKHFLTCRKSFRAGEISEATHVEAGIHERNFVQFSKIKNTKEELAR